MSPTKHERKAIQYDDTYSANWIHYLSPRTWRGKVEVEFREIPLALIDGAGCYVHWDVTEGWYFAMLDRRPIPPLVVVASGDGRYYVHDGNHRLEALVHYLGREAALALVRVAVAVPKDGYQFAWEWYGSFGTFALHPWNDARCTRRIETAEAMPMRALLPTKRDTQLLSGPGS
jgi:hypothetical protein